MTDIAIPAEVTALAAQIHALNGRLRRRLRQEASGGDLTPSQAAALVRLEKEGPLTVTTLANAEGVRPQSMGATVAVLEAAELIAGAPDPTDGRRTLLSLTPKCAVLLRQGRAARLDWLAGAIEARLDPAERQALAHAITLLARLVEP